MYSIEKSNEICKANRREYNRLTWKTKMLILNKHVRNEICQATLKI